MLDLTIIKRDGGCYIDSREVAVAIRKSHNHLLRDIRVYCAVLEKFSGVSKVGRTDYFLESAYTDMCGREKPCFLLSKMGCELVANKLIGERGILFTAAYVAKFNEMEAAEREAEIKAHAKPRLGEFNYAVRNVLSGMAYCFTAPLRVMGFLRNVYEPLGIKVLTEGDDRSFSTATEIAVKLGVYSVTGRPHSHAVAAIISKLNLPAGHAVVIPYGLVGVSMRYDERVAEAVSGWIKKNGFPSEVPYNGFEYHIYYNLSASLFDDADFCAP